MYEVRNEEVYYVSGIIDRKYLTFNYNDYGAYYTERIEYDHDLKCYRRLYYIRHVYERYNCIYDNYGRIIPPSELDHVQEWINNQKEEPRKRRQRENKHEKYQFRRVRRRKNTYIKAKEYYEFFESKKFYDFGVYRWDDYYIRIIPKCWKDQSKKRKQYL